MKNNFNYFLINFQTTSCPQHHAEALFSERRRASFQTGNYKQLEIENVNILGF